MRKILFLLLTAFCMSAVYSQTTKKYPSIDIPFKKYVLDNGLTLIVHEDHKLPIASFNIWYHVGSKNEKIGKTGFAHLFEHIMFTTTEHWSNFDEVMQTVGGANNNGTTSYDRTNYNAKVTVAVIITPGIRLRIINNRQKFKISNDTKNSFISLDNFHNNKLQ